MTPHSHVNFAHSKAADDTVSCYHFRNTEVLQEQLQEAHSRAEAAEHRAAEADQLSQHVVQLQLDQKTWDKVLQVALMHHTLKHIDS